MKSIELTKEEQATSNFNKLIIHPAFKKTIEEIKKLNIQLPPSPTYEQMDFQAYTFPKDGELVSNIENKKRYDLDPKNGQDLLGKGLLISAYDESINKYSALAGVAFLTSHSLIIHHKDDFLSSNLLTFYFYTKSDTYTKNSEVIKHSAEPEVQSKKDYAEDRTNFIVNTVPSNSVLFIDGPLIGGNLNTYTVKLNRELLKKNVIPIFFVKNSAGSLVTDNIKELRGKYNSDMHWSYEFLKPGQRTSFFSYVDKYNKNHAKIFCYFKAFERSPQRIELHLDTFKRFKNRIKELMDLIHYLTLVQGDLRNPQIRPIAIAEKYARATLKINNLERIMRSAGVVPTMNQERFGW